MSAIDGSSGGGGVDLGALHAVVDVDPAASDGGAATTTGPAGPASATPARGGAPARPVPGAGAASGGAASGGASGAAGAAPIPAAVYGPIVSDLAGADWSGLGIDPVRYTEDRLDRARFLDPLLASPTAKVVLHRDALKIGQVPALDGSRTTNVALPRAKDYPGRVYHDRQTDTYHLVGIPGEDWFRQTLCMLAVAGVPAAKVAVAGTGDPSAVIARDLDPVLAEHDFASVTIGTMGELTRAVERVVRAREQPAHVERVLGEMAAFLDASVAEARPDRRERWEARRTRLRDLEREGGDAAARLARVRADPALAGPLAALIARADAGAGPRELPIATRTRGGDLLSHRVLEVDGQKHLLIHVGGAHGDLAYHAVKHVLAREPALARVNMYGSAGSFSDALPPDTFILPSGGFLSHEEGRAPVGLANRAALAGARETRHTNVSTLLREHRGGLDRMIATPADSVDMESYHVARAASEAGRPVELRAILRISDVATSAHLGAHRDDRAGTSDYDARARGEEAVVVALGLVGEAGGGGAGGGGAGGGAADGSGAGGGGPGGGRP